MVRIYTPNEARVTELLRGHLQLPSWPSGAWVDSRATIGGTHATQELTADTIYSSPLWVPRPTAVDRIAINVTGAGGVGTEARLLLYQADADGLPGDLLLDAGTVAVDVTGRPELVIAQTLSTGLIFPSVVSDGTPTLASTASTSLLVYGQTLAAVSTSVNASPLRAGQDIATPPDPFGPTGFQPNHFIRVALRVAEL